MFTDTGQYVIRFDSAGTELDLPPGSGFDTQGQRLVLPEGREGGLSLDQRAMVCRVARRRIHADGRPSPPPSLSTLTTSVDTQEAGESRIPLSYLIIGCV